MQLNYIENDYATYSIDDGIVHIIYKDGIILNLEAAVKVVQDRLTIQDDKFYPVLCNILGVRAIDKSARDYLAVEGSVLITSVAFLVKLPVSTWLSEFYLQTSKPPVPTKTFTELIEAKRFLNEYKGITPP